MVSRTGWAFLAALAASQAAGPARAEDTRTLQGRALELRDVCARQVTVETRAGQDGVSVAATADHSEEIAALTFAGGDVARIGRQPNTCRFLNGPTLTLTITAAEGIPVTLLEGGASDYTLGDVGALRVGVSGSARLDARKASGETTIDITGSGHARIGEVDGALHVEISGSGGVTVQTVNAPRSDVTISGSGSVSIAGGSVGALDVRTSGVGRVDIGATATDATLESSGVGSIRVAHATGHVSRSASGIGRIEIGQ